MYAFLHTDMPKCESHNMWKSRSPNMRAAFCGDLDSLLQLLNPSALFWTHMKSCQSQTLVRWRRLMKKKKKEKEILCAVKIWTKIQCCCQIFFSFIHGFSFWINSYIGEYIRPSVRPTVRQAEFRKNSHSVFRWVSQLVVQSFGQRDGCCLMVSQDICQMVGQPIRATRA